MKIFRTPDGYTDMLNTIGWFTFVVLVLLTLMIRSNIPEVDEFLCKFEPSFKVPINDIEFEFYTVFIPIILAIQ